MVAGQPLRRDEAHEDKKIADKTTSIITRNVFFMDQLLTNISYFASYPKDKDFNESSLYINWWQCDAPVSNRS